MFGGSGALYPHPMVKESEKEKDEPLREKTTDFFGYIEDLFYVAVAGALVLIGVAYFGYAIYDFIRHVVDGGEFSILVIDLLSNLLLVFIVTEIVHTIRAVIDEKIIVAEPFLLVGIVAAIRRLVVLSAEAQDLLGKPEFGDAMLELAVLGGIVFGLGLTVFLLRSRGRSEPTSEHEPD